VAALTSSQSIKATERNKRDTTPFIFYFSLVTLAQKTLQYKVEEARMNILVLS
jgi:hypothetical protein